uniref:Uncharacterized protein n=1 Tax=Setaria viridis TaxID=4556 RepID=A0A4V6DBB1_SETVI|nr:hypothetical protein SEVIR_2G175700v2 [Setaria viridis]
MRTSPALKAWGLGYYVYLLSEMFILLGDTLKMTHFLFLYPPSIDPKLLVTKTAKVGGCSLVVYQTVNLKTYVPTQTSEANRIDYGPLRAPRPGRSRHASSRTSLSQRRCLPASSNSRHRKCPPPPTRKRDSLPELSVVKRRGGDGRHSWC